MQSDGAEGGIKLGNEAPIIYSENGYLGIGTTTPSQLFSVNNKFMVDEFGNVTAKNITAENYIGLGTWQTNGDNIYYEDGNVGIGTDNPNNILHIKSDNPVLRIEKTRDATMNPSITFVNSAETPMSITYENSALNFKRRDILFSIENNGDITSEGSIYYNGVLESENFEVTDGGSIYYKGVIEGANFEVTQEGHVFATFLRVDIDQFKDYVFYPEYQLMPLNEVETFINTNYHLPEVPSEAEVLENGMNVGEFSTILLQKIEELTLYTIEQNKQIIELNKKIIELEQKIENNK